MTFWPTGKDLRDLYTKLHNGAATKTLKWTPSERETRQADEASFGKQRVAYMDFWETGAWPYEEKGATMIEAQELPGLEEVARKFL